jgi:hypothetical protein
MQQQPRRLRRAVWNQLLHLGTTRLLQAQCVRLVLGEVLEGDSEPALAGLFRLKPARPERMALSPLIEP